MLERPFLPFHKGGVGDEGIERGLLLARPTLVF